MGKTKLVWIETPANPTWDVTDVRRVCDRAHAFGASVCVDNTVLTPLCCAPIRLGADFVMHSATKYLNGHSDVVAGAVVAAVDDERLELARRHVLDAVVLGDFNATPWNDAFQAMRRECGLSAGSTRWWLPSWPDPLPGLLRVPIDHVLVGGDLTVVDARLGPSIGSDHRPVLATIRVGR